jgi:HK97 family phage prohead protease
MAESRWKLEGYAILWDTPALGNVAGKPMPRPRVYRRGCFRYALQQGREVVLAVGHGGLAASSTARDLFLEEDAKGLRFWCWPDATPEGERAILRVMSGQCTEVSLGLKDETDYRFTHDEVLETRDLVEVCLVPAGACPGTSVVALSPERQAEIAAKRAL